MPPPISEDEGSDPAVEDVDVRIHKASKKSILGVDGSDEQMNDDEDTANDEAGEEEDEEEADEGEFVVEAIKSHLVDDFGIKFHVKWEGYEKKTDMTWEPEENLRHVNLGSADEILERYLKSVGGREQLLNDATNQSEAKPKKRGRASTATATPDRKQNGKRLRKNTSHPASTTPPASHAKASFKPPSGTWEDDVQAIDACEGTDGKVMVFLHWISGHRTQHPLEQVYKRCPQKMLKFYEAHLSFTQVNDDIEPSADISTVSSKRGPGRPRKTKKT